MTWPDHLDDGALMRLLDGVADADVAPTLPETREHLAACPVCRTRLAELSAGDRTWKEALAERPTLEAPALERGIPGTRRGRRRLLAVAAGLALLAAVPPVRAAVASGWGWIRDRLHPAATTEPSGAPPPSPAEGGGDAVELQVAGRWLTLNVTGSGPAAKLRVVRAGGSVGILHLGGSGRARLTISGDTLRLVSVAGVTYRLELPSSVQGLTVTVEDSVVLRRSGPALMGELPLDVPLEAGPSP